MTSVNTYKHLIFKLRKIDWLVTISGQLTQTQSRHHVTFCRSAFVQET